MHPLEDWAETWCHYLHMVDTLETATGYGLILKPPVQHDPSLTDHTPVERSSFQSRSTGGTLTYAINGLGRSLGVPDAYPFSLSPTVIAKLAFVHRVVHSAARSQGQRGAAAALEVITRNCGSTLRCLAGKSPYEIVYALRIPGV